MAELHAGMLGLEQAIIIQGNRLSSATIRQVVLKSDSEYLVKGMTEWLSKWESNGYRTAKGAPVANLELFQKLRKLVGDLDTVGIDVLFWHVERKFNKVADKCASMALA